MASALVSANAVAVQLEKVRPKVPMLYERDNKLFARLEKKGDVISTRSARIPLQLRPGGASGMYNPDGGDMGSGTASIYDVATISPSHFKFGVEMTKLAEIGTDSTEKAVLNVVKAEVKNGMAQFRAFLDKMTNQSSTGELGVVSSISGQVITLSTSGVGSGFTARQRFHTGMFLSAANTGITGLVNSGADLGPITVIDDANGKLTLASTSAMPAGTDRLFVQGSTFDIVTAHAATSVALYGVPYHQSSAQTGTWLSFNRANYPEVWTPAVSAGSTFLTTAQIRGAKNKIRLALGADSIGKLVAYCNPKQVHAYEDLGIIISEIHKGGGNDALDMFFDEDKMRLDGTPLLVSINADPTRLDFLDLDKWGRVVTEEIDFHQVGNDTVFPKYGGSGGLAAAKIFYFTTSFQIFSESPASGAYVSSLSVPSVY